MLLHRRSCSHPKSRREPQQSAEDCYQACDADRTTGQPPGPAGSDPRPLPPPLSLRSACGLEPSCLSVLLPPRATVAPEELQHDPAWKQLARGREGKEQQYIQVSRVSLSQTHGHCAEGEGLGKSEDQI